MKAADALPRFIYGMMLFLVVLLLVGILVGSGVVMLTGR